MKTYDRESKRWVDEENLIIIKKAREKCKAGRKHDYVETLPDWGVIALENWDGNIEPYYTAMAEIEDFKEAKSKELEAFGMRITTAPARYKRFNIRYFVCSTCFKKMSKEV
jgi:hypothetical protein